MTISTTLSVAEMDHQSDRVGLLQASYSYKVIKPGTGVRVDHTLQFEITSRQNLVLKSKKTEQESTWHNGGHKSVIEDISVEFDKLDIDSLIQFLQDAKEFVREDLVFRKLKGAK